MDIEQLLIWAYQNEKADVLVGRGTGLLPDERRAAGLVVREVSGDGCASIERGRVMGCRIDGGGPRVVRVNENAEVVHEAVMSLPGRVARGVLIECAKTASRPDWMPGAVPFMEPVRVKRGKRAGQPVRIYDRDRHWIGSEITIGLAQRTIDARRALYAVWQDGLVALVRLLEGQLRGVRLTGPVVPPSPWLHFSGERMLTAKEG